MTATSPKTKERTNAPASIRSALKPALTAKAQSSPPRASTPLRMVGRPDTDAEAPEPATGGLGDILTYQYDAWQRSVLFLDVLRQRADNMLEHKHAGLPPLLDFEYETILDARRFDHPANYALLRITGWSRRRS